MGFAVRTAASPRQIFASLFELPDVSATLIVGVGNALTVTAAEVTEAQLMVELVTVTVYVVVEEGATVLLFPVALIGAPHE